MRRREFIALLSGVAIAWPLDARGEQPKGMRRIGMIVPYPENDPQSKARIAAFRTAFQQLGWQEGRNITIDYRWDASNIERIRAHAAELVSVSENLDVIVANSTPVVNALLQHTRSIPIVFVSVLDPIGQHVVASFARPGGNVTGFTNVEPELGGKLLEMLSEVAPSTIRVAPIYHPEIGPSTELFMPSIAQTAALHGIKVIPSPVRSPTEIESALTALGQEPGGGVIVMLDTFVTAHRKLIMSLTERHRLPAIWPVPFFAKEGALIASGADIVDLYRRAAPYVDRILKGAKPADLPVQAPTKFELVINLKTAKMLGLQVPAKLIAIADEVIE